MPRFRRRPPVNVDTVVYKCRNVVERRCSNRFRSWRALGTRYDKHAVIYRGGLLLAAVLLQLRE